MGLVLSNTAKFDPYTFDELIKPYLMYKKEYDSMLENLSNLLVASEALRQYAEENKNSKEAIKYNNYIESLKNKSDLLASQGLKGVNKKDYYDLKALYNNVIKPLEDKAKRKLLLVDELRKGEADGDLFYDKYYENIPLDDITPTSTYHIYSRSAIGKRVALLALSLKQNSIEIAKLLNSNIDINLIEEYLNMRELALQDAGYYDTDSKEARANIMLSVDNNLLSTINAIYKLDTADKFTKSSNDLTLGIKNLQYQQLYNEYNKEWIVDSNGNIVYNPNYSAEGKGTKVYGQYTDKNGVLWKRNSSGKWLSNDKENTMVLTDRQMYNYRKYGDPDYKGGKVNSGENYENPSTGKEIKIPIKSVGGASYMLKNGVWIGVDSKEIDNLISGKNVEKGLTLIDNKSIRSSEELERITSKFKDLDNNYVKFRDDEGNLYMIPISILPEEILKKKKSKTTTPAIEDLKVATDSTLIKTPTVPTITTMSADSISANRNSIKTTSNKHFEPKK